MHRKPPNESDIVLPITPFLDMTFQLLFFFMASFNPADQEGQIDMALPSEVVTQAHDQKNVEPKPVDKDPLEFPSDLTVKVRTQQNGVNDGDISALAVQTLDKEEAMPDTNLTTLREYLVRKRDESANKENIKVQGDSKLKVRGLMKVMDVCRQ